VKQTGGTEKVGEVLGSLEDGLVAQQEPLSGNLYFPVARDLGAVDGISYGEKAEPADRETFLALEGMPAEFGTDTVRFRYPGGQERSFTVDIGDSIPPEYIPLIPPKKEYVVSWEGLETEMLSNILFDMTFQVQYAAKRTALQAKSDPEEETAVLIQGTFDEAAQALLTISDRPVNTLRGETLLGTFDLKVTAAEEITGIRVRIPEGLEAGNVKLLLTDSSGQWYAPETENQGSYLTAALTEADCGIALVRRPSYRIPLLIGAAAAALLAAVLLLRRRRKCTGDQKS